MPDRVWGTYHGGDLPESGLAVAVDAAGDVYVAGLTSSDEGIATRGAHKTVRQGVDAYIVKFDAGGARQWGTYFGGSGADHIFAIAAVDGGVVIAGRTSSPEGIAMPGAHQPVAGGLFDGFVARFGSDGVQAWGSYLGSNWDDFARAVAVDPQGAIYVGGVARGPLPGVDTSGTHQPAVTKSGVDDGFVVRLDPGGQVVWGTYYGGTRVEHVTAVAPAPGGAVYVAGFTLSADKIASAGAHDEMLAKDDDIDEVTDSHDAFLARLADDGTRVWGTYLGGLGEEGFAGVVALPDGGAIAAGASSSKTGIATPGAFQGELANPGFGASDGLLVRFDAAGEQVWATYYGGDSVDQLEAVTTDTSGALIVLGLTHSPGLATPDAFMPTWAGAHDVLLARFTPDGARSWATYVGGDAIELPGGFAVAGDRIYVHGTTHSAGLATPGAHLEDLNVKNVSDGFLVRFTQGAGAPCDGPDACPSGACVDGVCCDAPCGGGADDCQVCSEALGATADGECTLLAADVVCRPAADACDAAELCSGDAGTCPDDAPVPDGEPCDDGVCEAGSCEPAAATSAGTTDATSGATDATTTTGEADATSVASEPVPEDSTGATPSTGVPTGGGPDDTTTSTTGEDPASDGDGGCACRQTPGPGLSGLFTLLVLAACRRRARA